MLEPSDGCALLQWRDAELHPLPGHQTAQTTSSRGIRGLGSKSSVRSTEYRLQLPRAQVLCLSMSQNRFNRLQSMAPHRQPTKPRPTRTTFHVLRCWLTNHLPSPRPLTSTRADPAAPGWLEASQLLPRDAREGGSRLDAGSRALSLEKHLHSPTSISRKV